MFVDWFLHAGAITNVWVGGISSSISKYKVDKEFRMIGKIEGV